MSEIYSKQESREKFIQNRNERENVRTSFQSEL